jgi:hypothetical protein
MPLYFPDSENGGDTDPSIVKFRDGERSIAPYLAVLMGALDTERLTYEEARAIVNQDLAREFVTKHQERLVANHLRDWGG